MKKSRVVFLDIDTQYDFMHPEGCLYVPGAEKIEPQLRQLLNFAQAENIPVLASADAHTADDPEFALFPPHCVKGTAGQAKIEATQFPGAQVIANQKTALELRDIQQVVLEKTVFDIFGNPNTERILAEIEAWQAVVFGVATDYCVKAAVLGLKKRGYDVTVVTDAIKAVTPEGEKETLELFAQQGVHFKTTEDVIGGIL